MKKLFQTTNGGYMVYYNDKEKSNICHLFIYEIWGEKESLKLIIQNVKIYTKEETQLHNILYSFYGIDKYILDIAYNIIDEINKNDDIKAKVLKTLK